jgi:hypothetical protein
MKMAYPRPFTLYVNNIVKIYYKSDMIFYLDNVIRVMVDLLIKVEDSKRHIFHDELCPDNKKSFASLRGTASCCKPYNFSSHPFSFMEYNQTLQIYFLLLGVVSKSGCRPKAYAK